MPKRVSPAEAAELLGRGWIYLDVRSVPEFDEGHPAAAYNVPLMHLEQGRMAPNPDFERVVGAFLDKSSSIVVGCKSGVRSLRAAVALEAAGFTEVVDMRGGFGGERDPFGRISCPGWVDCGLPISRIAEPGKSYRELEARSSFEPGAQGDASS